MTTAERLILQAADRHHGACRRSHLLQAGVSRSAIDRRVRSGLLRPVAAGVYLVSGRHDDVVALAAAALLAAPQGAVSHWTAAQRHGFVIPASPAAHVVVPRGCHRPALEGGVALRVHESSSLTPSDVTMAGGLRCTSAARTICDLASHLRPSRLRHLCEQRLLLSAPSAKELLACHRALSRRGRPGTVRLRSVLDELLDDEPFPESELELALLRVLAATGLEGFRRQYRPRWFDGVRGVVDFAHPGARLVIEADGRRWHSTRQAFEDDRRRDRLAARHGWRTVRFGWHEITGRPDEVASEIAGLVQGAARPVS